VFHCTIYYLNIDIFQFTREHTKSEVVNKKQFIINEDLNTSIETSINELKNLNQYIDNGLE
jgi:hypothetical protein